MARIRALLHRPYGSLRQMLRELIPLKHRRRVVRYVRQLFGTAWSASATSATASLRAWESIVEVTAQQRCDIICFPIIEWDFRFQRPQQLMSRFAAAGHRVFYISQNFRGFGEPCELSIKAPNVYEVSLRGPDRNVYLDSLGAEDVGILLSSLDGLRRNLSFGATAAIVQLPFWRPLVKLARARFGWPIIYDCMDYHAGFSTNRAEMLDEEDDLIASSDCVLVSSRFLEQQIGKSVKRMLLLPNACDFDHFAKVSPRKSGPRPVIGYYGAIADWFDTELVADLAERNTQWDLLLIGSTFSADLRRLRKLANVSLVGEQPYSQLPHWLEQIDVLILPFLVTPLTEATNPVKAFEILAAGKPLVSVPIAEMKGLGPMVRLAATVEEFEGQIREALAEDLNPAIENRRTFARENTWQKRFEELEPALRETFPLASIVIVTYNNLELNRLCLQSLFTNTEWPNFEVIVVDNGSTDGTTAFLEDSVRGYPSLKVIFNEHNLGFAAANNQGLAEARGQFLVLLNNDTALPRGWLTALIRHLSTDKTIGLIGPMTNEIGNEAKVAVEYSSLKEMPLWSAQFMRQNDSQVFGIHMLAMFCVAMRREVFEQVGFLDERFGVGLFEDDDYSRRIRDAGYQILCARDSFVHHMGSASFKQLAPDDYFQLFERNRRLYEEKWGELWQPHEDDGARARVPALRTQLRRVISGATKETREVIVFLPGDSWQGSEPGRVHRMARAFAELGRVVIFDCSGSQRDEISGFVEVAPRLWLFKGPAGILDELEEPVLWAKACHVSLLKRWPQALIVYDCRPDLSERFQQGHKRLLAVSHLVVSESSDQCVELAIQRSDVDCLALESFDSLERGSRLILERLQSKGVDSQDAVR